MATPQAILRGKDTTAQGAPYSSVELGDKQWKITASDGKRNASRHSVGAGDTAAVADCLRKTKARFGLPEQAQVHSCYWGGWWNEHAQQVPPALNSEIERERERLALARRLVIALWRHLQHGEIPAGAQLKPAA